MSRTVNRAAAGGPTTSARALALEAAMALGAQPGAFAGIGFALAFCVLVVHAAGAAALPVAALCGLPVALAIRAALSAAYGLAITPSLRAQLSLARAAEFAILGAPLALACFGVAAPRGLIGTLLIAAAAGAAIARLGPAIHASADAGPAAPFAPMLRLRQALALTRRNWRPAALVIGAVLMSGGVLVKLVAAADPVAGLIMLAMIAAPAFAATVSLAYAMQAALPPPRPETRPSGRGALRRAGAGAAVAIALCVAITLSTESLRAPPVALVQADPAASAAGRVAPAGDEQTLGADVKPSQPRQRGSMNPYAPDFDVETLFARPGDPPSREQAALIASTEASASAADRDLSLVARIRALPELTYVDVAAIMRAAEPKIAFKESFEGALTDVFFPCAVGPARVAMRDGDPFPYQDLVEAMRGQLASEIDPSRRIFRVRLALRAEPYDFDAGAQPVQSPVSNAFGVAGGPGVLGLGSWASVIRITPDAAPSAMGPRETTCPDGSRPADPRTLLQSGPPLYVSEGLPSSWRFGLSREAARSITPALQASGYNVVVDLALRAKTDSVVAGPRVRLLFELLAGVIAPATTPDEVFASFGASW